MIFQKRSIFFLFLFLTMLVVWNGNSSAEEAKKSPTEQKEVSDSSDEKRNLVKFRSMMFGGQNHLKTGYTRIVRNFEDLKTFIIDLGGPAGAEKVAQDIAKYVDFSREVVVVVVNLPWIERCNGPLDPMLEWRDEAKIKVGSVKFYV